MAKAVNAILGVVLIAAGIYFHYGPLISAGAAMLLGAAAQALGPGSPRAPPTQGIALAYSGTLEPRRIIYGKLKVSGMHAIPPLTSGSNNDYFHDVLVLAGHTITSFGDVWFDQIRIPSAKIGAVTGSTGDGLVSGIAAPPSGQVNGQPYNNLAWVRRYTGSQVSVDGILNSAFTQWDTNHVGRELAYVAVQYKFDQKVFASGPPQLTVLVQGKAVYDPRLDTTNGGSGSQRYTDPTTWTYSANPALCLRDYLTASIGLGEANTRINDTLVAAAANKCDENLTVPIPPLDGVTNWVHASTTVNGINTAFQSVLSAGNYVRGPDGLMYQITTVVSDFQLTLTAAFAGTTTNNFVAQWNTANSTSTTQKRYTCNTILDATARFEDNITQLAQAMQGFCLYSGGKWQMYAGGWSGSAFTLAESDIVGSISVQCTTPRKDLYNSVRGNFIDPQQNYQPAEFPAIINSAYVTEDGGETIYVETAYACCTNTYEAQRNAIVLSRQSRNRRVVTAQFGMSAFRVKVWETGTVTIAELGWIAQTVRCTSWRFLPQGVIELQLQEAYSADWTDPVLADYQVKTANTTPLPLTYLPYPPTALVATPGPGTIAFDVTLPGQAIPGTLTELWEYTASTPFSSATLIATGATTHFVISKSDTVTRYYWARTRSPTSSQVSTTYPASTGLAAAALSAGVSPWIALGNAIVFDDSATKIGGVLAWDSEVYSSSAYQTCHIIGKTVSVGTSYDHDWMLGLSANPLLGPDYSTGVLNFGFYLNTNSHTWWYIEGVTVGGTLSAVGGAKVTDEVALTYDGTNARYYINRQLVRTTSSPGLTLNGCGLLNGSAPASINSLKFGPTTDLLVNDTPQLGLNAATDYASIEVSSFVLSYSGVLSAADLTVGPYPEDMTVVCTGTAQWAWNAGSGSNYSVEFQYGIGTSLAVDTMVTVAVLVPSSPAVASSGTCARERTFTQTAGTTVTYQFQGVDLPLHAGGLGATLTNIKFKAEVLKR